MLNLRSAAAMLKDLVGEKLDNKHRNLIELEGALGNALAKKKSITPWDIREIADYIKNGGKIGDVQKNYSDKKKILKDESENNFANFEAHFGWIIKIFLERAVLIRPGQGGDLGKIELGLARKELGEEDWQFYKALLRFITIFAFHPNGMFLRD
jgi:hypothetical protein